MDKAIETEKLMELVPGKQYTIVKFGEFGFLFKARFTLVSVEKMPYAQYDVSYLLTVKLVGKRKPFGIRIYDNRDFIVWEGIEDPETEMIVKQTVKDYGSGAMTIGESWRCFDPRYFDRALRSISAKPLIAVLPEPEVSIECDIPVRRFVD